MKKIWIEYLRVLAVIAVVTIHTTGNIYHKFGDISLHNWWLANILNTCSRFAVPLFVMISGCLLLGRNIEIQDFYIKRAIRLLPALLFWTLFYLAFNYVCKGVGLNAILWELKIGLFISGSAYYHLWYLPMVICLMMFAPFINNYVLGKKPNLKDFIYMFFVIALFMSMNQISKIGMEVLDQNISWFKSFAWYIGFFIMGYFIDKYYEKIHISNKLCMVLIGITPAVPGHC